MRKFTKRPIKASGYWADDVNADSNKKILQALRDAMYNEYGGHVIKNVDIEVYDVESGVSAGNYYFEIEFINLDTTEDVGLYVTSTAQSMGKFLCILSKYGVSEPYSRNRDALEKFTIRMSGSKDALSHEIERIAGSFFDGNTSQEVESSVTSAPKRQAIKASEAEKPVVMYFDGKKVYEGDINDIYSTIVELCKDEKNNQIFMEYLNQFGDPFDFDGTPEDTAETFAAWVGQDFDDAEFNEEDFYVQDTINGKSFEIFLKSDEAVEGSVQRRAKKSVKASKRPAPKRQAIKASEEHDPVLCAFVYCHGNKDFSIWETDAISPEDLNRIDSILSKYSDTGSSVRNVYNDLSEYVSEDYTAEDMIDEFE